MKTVRWIVVLLVVIGLGSALLWMRADGEAAKAEQAKALDHAAAVGMGRHCHIAGEPLQSMDEMESVYRSLVAADALRLSRAEFYEAYKEGWDSAP